MNVTIAGVSPRRRIRVTRLLCAGFRRSLRKSSGSWLRRCSCTNCMDARGAVALPSLFALY
jgi:hypothetical protein